jgi:hypothetical protein
MVNPRRPEPRSRSAKGAGTGTDSGKPAVMLSRRSSPGTELSKVFPMVVNVEKSPSITFF